MTQCVPFSPSPLSRVPRSGGSKGSRRERSLERILGLCSHQGSLSTTKICTLFVNEREREREGNTTNETLSKRALSSSWPFLPVLPVPRIVGLFIAQATYTGDDAWAVLSRRCAYVCVHARMYSYICVYMYVYVCLCVCVRVRARARTPTLAVSVRRAASVDRKAFGKCSTCFARTKAGES